MKKLIIYGLIAYVIYRLIKGMKGLDTSTTYNDQYSAPQQNSMPKQNSISVSDIIAANSANSISNSGITTTTETRSHFNKAVLASFDMSKGNGNVQSYKKKSSKYINRNM